MVIDQQISKEDFPIIVSSVSGSASYHIRMQRENILIPIPRALDRIIEMDVALDLSVLTFLINISSFSSFEVDLKIEGSGTKLFWTLVVIS